VSSQQQSRCLSVALQSQLQSVRARLYLTLYYVRPQLARAARAERRALRARPAGAPGSAVQASPVPTSPVPGSPAVGEPAGYAALLGSTYMVAPVLALVTWRGLAPILPGSAALGAAAALLLLLPPLIHVAQGATARGGRALASLLGYTVLGSAGGALLGRTLANLACSEQTHDECGLSLLAGLLLGAVAGGLLGYSVHGVQQVRRESRKHPPAELLETGATRQQRPTESSAVS
jgi:hypothetical protein